MQEPINAKTSTGRSSKASLLGTYGSGARLWLPLATILLIAVLVPVLLVGMMQRPGAALNATTATSDLLATMGGVMGAVFTIGGFAIALMSILSQLQLEDRMQRVLTVARQEIAQEFQTSIVPSLEQRMQAQVDSFLAFFEATLNVDDWETAQRLTAEALQGYPKLRGARRFLGLQMTNLVVANFERQLRYDQTTPQQNSPSASAGGDTVTRLMFYVPGATPPWNRRAPAPTVPSNGAIPQQTALLGTGAEWWLKEAFTHQEDADGSVSAALALIHAHNQAFDKMLGAVRDSLATNESKRQFLLTPSRLALLAYACENDERHLAVLGEALRYTLPVQTSAVTANLNEDPWEHERASGLLEWSMDWYALERGGPGQSVSPIPSTIRILGPDSDGMPMGQSGWSAQVFRPQGAPHRIASEDDATFPSKKSSTAEALIEELGKRFLFLCPVMSRSEYFDF